MAMIKARKPKRYASGGPVDTSNFPRIVTMPGAGYVGGVSPEHVYFQNNPNYTAPVENAPTATVDPNSFSGDFSGGDGGDGGGSGGGGLRRGGVVKAKKMAKGGAVKVKMGRGDGCAVRGKTKGTMR